MTHHAAFSWRWPGALLLTSTAAIHFALIPEHLREAPYAGILFALLSGSAMVLALLLLVADHPATWTGAAALSLGAIAGYIVSRSIGLPAMSDDVGDWLNPLGLAALVSEAGTVLIAGHVIRQPA